uniref:26S proteasome non-ATPase regulatory subunit 9 n=1 Tax=Rattus norvegicus TaxID=10116 RepID=PSMD9_RAT|nr:RecName: Full=26S proteasome non-ATPase regulatory subunit 9; AltName: Full=26S proteasome regulatory subunit p27; AltName: Full=Transactivating protein Bridge-1 [Rattus norvegicus]AAD32925.1 transactivating protein BRIDGE [Rattus norvegicus]|eukprot:NP_569114.1 26S proteasome non-ATPase regulatory subunit 9 [Rattus norvegicus]
MSSEEVRHRAESSEARAAAVSDIQELMRRKEEIEAQIKANYDVLESQKGIGMNEPLVDCEGYPRADVDLYQVRTARHNIICLQNDHKALMKQVEEALHQLHARDKEKQARDMAEAREEAMNRRLASDSPALPKAFARVNSISPGSPASIAGLQVDDEIVEFGSVNTQNFQSLQNVGTVVQHSEGKPLNVMVIRRGEKHQLRLTPTRWAGKGLLGCNITPLQR